MRQCPTCSAVYDDGVMTCFADGAFLAPPDPLLGRTLDGKYRIDVLLGRGGAGAVYRARQLALERDVALKLIRGDFSTEDDERERFKREALAIARLKHPHIVTLYDYSVSVEAGAYLVLEYVAGRPLGAEIRQRGRIPPNAALGLMVQICSAVRAAHEAGVIHRDLKPDNVLLEIASGGAVVAKVLDFGVAKIQHLGEARPGPEPRSEEVSLTAEDSFLGTPAYMSPEQCLWEPVDARSDIYSLGCALYEMLTGRPPFTAARISALVHKHVNEEPEPPSALVEGLPLALDGVLARALAKAPEDRYQTAAELGRALAAARGALDADLSFPPVLSATVEGFVPDAAAHGPWASVARAGVPNNLPHEVTSFVGRERDLAEVERLLAGGSRLVTLLGPGGIGKTRLALQIVARLLRSFDDGVWFVDLAPLVDPAHVAKAVATAAGVRDETGAPTAETLERAFASRRVLVVLDNCEHLAAASAGLADRLLAACPALRILATSQATLGIAAEVCYRVPPLSLPADSELASAAALAEAEAVTLFVDRARQQDPAFRLTAGNARTVARVCARLDGIPLAIELAAARTRVLSVEQIDARLEDRFGLLRGPGRGAPARQRALRAALDWSYGLLSEEEASLLRLLGVFAGSWTFDAVETVSRGAGFRVVEQPLAAGRGAWELLDLLTGLVDRSLVVVDARGDEVRYRLLETIRQYAWERAGEAGGVEALRQAHCDYYLALAEQGEPDIAGSPMERWFERFELEHDNFRAALAWCAARPDGAVPLLRMANALYRFWHVHGYLGEAHAWLERGLAAPVETPPAVRGRALYALGTIESIFGNFARAEALQEEALALQRECGDEAGQAFTLNSLGTTAYYRGDYAKALARYEAGAGRFRALRMEANLANVLTNLGMIVRNLGDYDRAEALYGEALAIGRALGHSMAIARSLMSIGTVAVERGAYDRAEALYEEALLLFRELGDRRMTASLLNNMGDVARFRGDRERAASLYREAVATHLDLGDRPNAVFSLASFASLAADAGRFDRALRLAGAFEALRGRFGLRLNPFEQQDFDAHLERAREGAGGAAAGLVEAGARMTLDEAIALAAVAGYETGPRGPR